MEVIVMNQIVKMVDMGRMNVMAIHNAHGMMMMRQGDATFMTRTNVCMIALEIQRFRQILHPQNTVHGLLECGTIPVLPIVPLY
jgi:hypothetical protein